MTYKTVTLKRGKEESLKRFHPWVFSGAIAAADDDIVEGDLVTVYAHDGKLIGNGHSQIGSIAVRMLTFDDTPIDEAFYEQRLNDAYRMRQALGLQRDDNNAYRLVHGEGDFLPGLVVDIYGPTAVMQAHSPGMHFARNTIAQALAKHYSQGRRVLNMFCYTGGFSVYALRGGAQLVHSVDSSAKAVRLTDDNVALNFAPEDGRHRSFAEDAFKFLDNMEKDAYDLIILDPPAFAKHKSALHNALIGYRRLNAKALEKIAPGSILFTFSCSQAVNKEQFRLAVFSAAAQTGRKVRILHQLTQPADHPINIYHPEGEYLKGLVLYVE